jgi:Fe-S-cluster containining protein
MECARCGTCCVAPDISALGKPLGVRCANLLVDGECSIYEERPAVCRGYRADELCLRIAAPTLEERVDRYLELFELQSDAKGLGIF